MNNPTIFVTKPYLPSLDELFPYLESIWESRTITNGGPLHQQLEAALVSYLNVSQISLFSNGTLGLITALQALGVSGEVITTPYSFVATAHSLLWNGLRPVFVDIDPETLNLDPKKIEQAITTDTTAILPVHCYGRPCDVFAIKAVADQHSLKVIYDAAHAFAVTLNGKSILKYGDLSVLSFHATKVFNTFEGGAIVSQDSVAKLKIDQLKNFGFVDEITVVEAGINGKMSEFNCAVGLLQLQHMAHILTQRERIASFYRSALAEVEGVRCLPELPHVVGNNSYFPIIIEKDYPITRDALYGKFRERNIFVRRYFYPLISEFPMYRTFASASASNLPVATDMARRILCLPIYPDLTESDQHRVVRTILDFEKG
jgi:dTDP-4-amino-4,6-dideoxygalactose transaminase